MKRDLSLPNSIDTYHYMESFDDSIDTVGFSVINHQSVWLMTRNYNINRVTKVTLTKIVFSSPSVIITTQIL